MYHIPWYTQSINIRYPVLLNKVTFIGPLLYVKVICSWYMCSVKLDQRVSINEQLVKIKLIKRNINYATNVGKGHFITIATYSWETNHKKKRLTGPSLNYSKSPLYTPVFTGLHGQVHGNNESLKKCKQDCKGTG